MTDGVLALAERLWRGEEVIDDHHPARFRTPELTEVADGVAFLSALGNAVAVHTDDGLLLVDGFGRTRDLVRRWSPAPLRTAVYSHGHVDHVMGVPPFEEEARENGWPAPTVVAHEAVPHRFERYVLTAGYNGVINQRQFQLAAPVWPTEYRYPDQTYRRVRNLEVGSVTAELHHARGETDDHTWTWLPDRRVLCTGDLFIWAVPNGGNPQKAQRYPREWAAALREMADLGAELLLPGHGVPVIGAERVRTALADTAELLESLVGQTLEMMNAGARLNDIIHSVRVPGHLAGKAYLQPVYDEPEFIVRNLWRLYGGWYEGDPAHLKPARDADLAAELAALAGGAEELARRGAALADRGDIRLACHLVELAGRAAPDDAAVHALRAEVYRQRVDAERSTMARGIYAWAQHESERITGGPGADDDVAGP